MTLAFRLFGGRRRKAELNADDIFNACRRLGLRDVSERDAKNMLREADASGSGGVSEDEFIAMMETKMAQFDPENFVLDAFHSFDPRATNRIDLNEFSLSLKNLGSRPFTNSEVYTTITTHTR